MSALLTGEKHIEARDGWTIEVWQSPVSSEWLFTAEKNGKLSYGILPADNRTDAVNKVLEELKG